MKDKAGRISIDPPRFRVFAQHGFVLMQHREVLWGENFKRNPAPRHTNHIKARWSG